MLERSVRVEFTSRRLCKYMQKIRGQGEEQNVSMSENHMHIVIQSSREHFYFTLLCFSCKSAANFCMRREIPESAMDTEDTDIAYAAYES